MKLVAMKCLSCGAGIDVSLDKKMAFCPYCGAKLLIDDEKHRIELSGKIEVSGIPTLDRLCTNAETFIAIGDLKNADRAINEIYNNYPSDYRGYYLSLLSKIKHMSTKSNNNAYGYNRFSDYAPHIRDVCNTAYKALHFAPTEKHREIKNIAYQWLKTLDNISKEENQNVEKYYQRKAYYEEKDNDLWRQVCEIEKEIDYLSVKEKKRKRNIYIASVVNIIGLLLLSLHEVFLFILFISFISTIIFIVMYFLMTKKITSHNIMLDKLNRSRRKIQESVKLSLWSDSKQTPEFTRESLDVYYSGIDNFQATVAMDP